LKGYNGNPLMVIHEGNPIQRAAARSKKRGILPSEQPEPLATRMSQVNALKSRQVSTRWSSKEFEAFKAAGLDEMSDFDFGAQWGPVAEF